MEEAVARIVRSKVGVSMWLRSAGRELGEVLSKNKKWRRVKLRTNSLDSRKTRK